MNICEPAIRRPVGTTLLAVGLLLVGVVAYRFLPVASMPTVDYPTISVTASRPGADPETMAATVAAPLERRLGEVRQAHAATPPAVAKVRADRGGRVRSAAAPGD